MNLTYKTLQKLTYINNTGYSSLLEHPLDTATKTPHAQVCKILPNSPRERLRDTSDEESTVKGETRQTIRG